ncbi:MAG: alpha/beta hydrolase [Pirellulaceae bacterium]|jgi:acetyl esterase/lipase|nr:alpha/beta hydrolase [Pirellulaceae bacterium]
MTSWLVACGIAVGLSVPAAARLQQTDRDPLPAARIALWNGRAPVGDGADEDAEAYLTVHRPATPNGAAIVICPGGGYAGLVTGPEGAGIASWLSQHGITGVVLEYRLPAGRPYVPLLDAQRALRLVRAQAAQWHLDPARIGILGFSAGGHLASTAGTHFDLGDPQAPQAVDRVSCRPDFQILIYPVITMRALTHSGSRRQLLGDSPSRELIDVFSNETQVTDRTPPAFLAHAQDDTAVVPAHSEMFHRAVRAHGVVSEYLALPSGGHGLNGYQGPSWDAWQAGCLEWLARQNFIPARASAGP